STPFFRSAGATGDPAVNPAGTGLPTGMATCEASPINHPLNPSSIACGSTVTQPCGSGTMKCTGGVGDGLGGGGVGEVTPVPRIRTDCSANGFPFQNVYRVPTRTSETKPPVM